MGGEGSLTTSHKGMKLRKIELYYDDENYHDDDDSTDGKEEGTFAHPENCNEVLSADLNILVNKVVAKELKSLIPALLKITHVTQNLEKIELTKKKDSAIEQAVKIMENDLKKEQSGSSILSLNI
jgi:hypothetical protein